MLCDHLLEVSKYNIKFLITLVILPELFCILSLMKKMLDLSKYLDHSGLNNNSHTQIHYKLKPPPYPQSFFKHENECLL